MSDDLEKAGVGAATSLVPLYGATELGQHKADNIEKLPLLLGLWQVQPRTLYVICVVAYVCWFTLYRIADIAYILTVDARFPSGLGHHYPSEEERLASVSYTRQVLLCRMLRHTFVFAAVLTIVLFGWFARFDAALRWSIETTVAWWESSRIGAWCSRACECFAQCWSPVALCMWAVFGRLLTWCSEFQQRLVNGRLSADIHNRIGFSRSWRELLFGSLYLTLFAALFFLISAPFDYWSALIDINFGFSNPSTSSASSAREEMFSPLVSLLMFGIPLKFVYLAILQYRFGWLFLWIALVTLLGLAQYNIEVIAPLVLDMKTPFPNNAFAVGRGFPWVSTDRKAAPWISLNRIYFKDPSSNSASAQFSTMDKSKGQLTLSQHPTGTWAISSAQHLHSAVYAESTSAASASVMDGLRSSSWSVGGTDARMGVRSGRHLRDELAGFARENHIGIAQIYMVDGSHKDIRANAFVAGAGNNSVIGLFDTLFLGQRNSGSDHADASSDVAQLLSDDSAIQHASEIVQNIDAEEDARDRRSPRNSAPTEAMNDDEIISILAHELGHAALKHLEKGMVEQAIISFVTFATLGWVAHSPLAAAALSLHVPLLHVGACAYEHVVGPPLEGVMKLFSDAHTRVNEYEADAYAARISEKYAIALQDSLGKMSVNSNQDPDAPYYYEVLHFDHPTFARRWAHIEDVRKETYSKHGTR